ncbi:hypothetical protein ACFVAJ_17975 [Agromyces sp. NPDC057679]|uniref:hypothetical protein n=1 Tax=Agromyces sp. NPDC057679 TaxID=3346207 RepID=UPI00366F335F
MSAGADEANTISGDAEACEQISAAVDRINGAGISSSAEISEAEGSLFAPLARVANMAARTGIWEGDTSGGATTAEVVDAAAKVAAPSVGAAAINDGVTDKDRTVYEVWAVSEGLHELAEACAAVGEEMSVTAFVFPTPPAEGQEPAPAPEPAAPEAPSILPGFKDAGNGLAYKFVDDAQCDYLSCVQVELYAYGDCPTSVYLEGSTIDGAGTVYGMTNDLLGPLRSGDTAIATLTIVDDAATGVRLNEITCI